MKKETKVTHSKPNHSSGVRLRKKEARRNAAAELHAAKQEALRQLAQDGDVVAQRKLAFKAGNGGRVRFTTEQLAELARRTAMRASLAHTKRPVLDLISK